MLVERFLILSFFWICFFCLRFQTHVLKLYCFLYLNHFFKWSIMNFFLLFFTSTVIGNTCMSHVLYFYYFIFILSSNAEANVALNIIALQILIKKNIFYNIFE